MPSAFEPNKKAGVSAGFFVFDGFDHPMRSEA